MAPETSKPANSISSLKSAGDAPTSPGRANAKAAAGDGPSPLTNTPVKTHIPPENIARSEIADLRPNPSVRVNPPDFSISLRNRMGTDQQLHNPGPRRQSMRGFEDHYVDIIDYIIRATHRAWEEKDIGYVYDFYRHNIIVRDEFNVGSGRDNVIANSLGMMNAFPDMRWIPAEVIWAGDDENGFHTSHRSFFVGTNTGWSQYGPPTGRRCTWWVQANCITIGNEIYDEWVIENSASMIQQLGLDVRKVARETANALDVDLFAQIGVGEPHRLMGQGKPEHLPPAPRDAPFDPEDFVRRMMHYVWNWRLIGKTRDYCSPGIRAFGPSGRAIYGLGDFQQSIVSRLAMFPDLALSVDDVYWMGNDREGYMVNVRWTMIGTHNGNGVYGPPTGRRVRMWGINHYDIRNGRIVEEWSMFNEFAVLQQLYRDAPVEPA